MTAYVKAGDKAIVYAGNLHMGEWEKFLGALRDQGVEVIAPLAPGSLPAGPPSVLAVIETPERCEMCGYHPGRRPTPNHTLPPMHTHTRQRHPIPRQESPMTQPIETGLDPRIVCLCGSTRFTDAFREANLRETLAGRIVLSIGCDTRSDTDLFGHLLPDEIQQLKTDLDELHKRKIDLADEILVLNVDGYIGNSTRSEIDYARTHSKPVRWLETHNIPTEYTVGGTFTSENPSSPVGAMSPVVDPTRDVDSVAPVDAMETSEAAARRYAGELVRLQEGLTARGWTPPPVVPVDEGDQVIIDEAVSSDLGMRAVRAPMDCERSELHAPHPWYCATEGLTYYCKGIPS